MPKNTSFAVLYKKLLDCNFSPDPERADAALDAVLRQLSAADPPELPVLFPPDEFSVEMRRRS